MGLMRFDGWFVRAFMTREEREGGGFLSGERFKSAGYDAVMMIAIAMLGYIPVIDPDALKSMVDAELFFVFRGLIFGGVMGSSLAMKGQILSGLVLRDQERARVVGE